MRAADNGRADCARLLLDAGADKNAKDRVRAMRCVRMGRWRVGQMLIIDGYVMGKNFICILFLFFHFDIFINLHVFMDILSF
jgi:hypothetical protein